jgi:hypothetical protein
VKRTGIEIKHWGNGSYPVGCMLKSLLFLFMIQAAIGDTVYGQQTEKFYLSGTGEDNTVTWQFFCTGGMNAGKWTTIQVPSNWELQGFGKYDYGFAKDTVRGKEKGLYKYSFEVPSSFKNKKINIVFEGSMTDTDVKINGKSAGPTHQGAFLCVQVRHHQVTESLGKTCTGSYRGETFRKCIGERRGT